MPWNNNLASGETLMATSNYWADNYAENRRSAREALSLIKPGQRVFIGSSCGEPQHLVRELSQMSNYLRDIEINRLMTLRNHAADADSE